MLKPHKEIIIPAKFSGERLQNVLRRHLGEGYSGKRIKQIIDSYGCRVNGKIELFSSYKVRLGDKIQVDVKQGEVNPVPSCKILYEDEDLLIWDKPAHTVSEIKSVQKLFSSTKIHLVHRLDKDTTGVMLLAKNVPMQKILEELFKRREIEKMYHAIVKGESRLDIFTVENTLGKITQYQGQSVWGMVPEGVYALTHFEVLKRSRGHLLIKCAPVTGRTHQIRVHLSERGLPILGDHHYARDQVFKYSARRSLLHASSVRFIHPKSQKQLVVHSPYPEDFQQALNDLF